MATKMTYVRRTKVIEDALILLFSIFTHNSISFKICVNQSMYSLSTIIGKNSGQKHLSTNTANLRSGVSFFSRREGKKRTPDRNEHEKSTILLVHLFSRFHSVLK